MDQTNSTHIESHVLRRFNVIKKVGSGAYGHVWKVEDRNTKQVFALKKIFDAFQHSTDAQRTYRQIEILRQTKHTNIIKLYETIRADNNKDVYLVFEFMEADLHNVIAEGILKEVHIRFIIYQVAKSLKYLHSGSIIHRDLKPSNVLINSNCGIKLCDFGLVRSLMPGDETVPILTEGVATRWYRAPEVLLGSKSYSTPADIWSFGCIVFQILAQKPLFPGNSTSDQIDKILSFSGTPSQQDIQNLESQIAKTMLKESKVTHSANHLKTMLKDFHPMFTDLVEKMTTFNPKKRISINDILGHEVVKPFRKVQEQICCTTQIRTSIDDNKKLKVEEYRSLIYGAKRAVTPGSSKISANLPKKSSSFTKISSNSSFTEKDCKPERQTLKYVRSAKDVARPMHTYNKSVEMGSENLTKYRSEHNAEKREAIKDPTKSTYLTKNYYSPKYGDSRVPSTHSAASLNPQKFTREVRPIFKSSKYLITKTENAAQEK